MYKQLLVIVCAVVISMIPIASSLSAIDGLVGAWLFDDDSGNKVIDSSERGHDGELVGNAKIDKNGKIGSAVSTDGTEAYVMIPDHEDFKFKGDFSIVCWFQNETTPNDPSGIVTKGYHKTAANGGDAKPWYLVYYLNAGTVDFFLRDTKGGNSHAIGKTAINAWYLVYYLNAGTVDFFLRDTKGGNSHAIGKTAINDGKWHHVACMKAGNKVKVYIDGKDDGSADAVDDVYGNNTQPLVFMVHYERWLKGMIDEVAIFNRAISDKEITQIMGGLKNTLAVTTKDKLAVTWGQLK